MTPPEPTVPDTRCLFIYIHGFKSKGDPKSEKVQDLQNLINPQLG